MAKARAARGAKKMSVQDEALVTTTVKITRRQWEALRQEAMARALAAEAGDRRHDASKIIRELLDEWIAKHAR